MIIWRPNTARSAATVHTAPTKLDPNPGHVLVAGWLRRAGAERHQP
jgi:hypothetical protein